MPQTPANSPDDPFAGLRLPIEAWKVIDDAHITSLEQLKALAPLISQIPHIDPATAQIITDRLDRFAARRTVRVRLVFPKRPHRTAGRKNAHSRRRPPTKSGAQS